MQQIDINIIEWIQSLRNGFLDFFFQVITFFGDQLFFILIGVLLFWLYNKKTAFKLVLAFLISSIIVGITKVIVARKRPYELGNSKIESVGSSETHGYSFPSGHSQGSGLLFYGLKDIFNKKWFKYLLMAILILVPLSRMYLGQHFLSDVIVGTAIGILGVILASKLINLMGDKEHIYPLYGIPVAIIGLIILLVLQGRASYTSEFYFRYQDLFKMIGAYIGFSAGYALEKVYVKHDVNATIKVKLLKVIVGLLPLAAIYFGLSAILPKDGLASMFRYLLVALWAVLGAPYVFTLIFKDQNTVSNN